MKRTRDIQNYKEDSDDSKELYTEISTDDIPSYTSKWTLEHRKAMKILFINANSIILQDESIMDIHYSKLLLEGVDRSKIKAFTNMDITNIVKYISEPAVGTIISKINSIVIKE